MTTNYYLNSPRKYPVSNRRRRSPYNVIEEYVDGHKVLNYVPSSYGSNYNLSKLDENVRPIYYHPRTIKQRYYQASLNNDDNDEEEIIEEYIVSPRQVQYASPRRSQIINRVYYEPAETSDIVEYVYENDLRPKDREIVEYVIPDRTPRKRYIEENHSNRHNTNATSLPPISRSPRSPSTSRPIKPFQSIEDLSPRRSTMKQQTPRKLPMRSTPRNAVSQNKNQSKHISLRQVLAENRARRGSRIPKPRREVDLEEPHDPPTYNKDFVKNDFLVHK